MISPMGALLSGVMTFCLRILRNGDNLYPVIQYKSKQRKKAIWEFEVVQSLFKGYMCVHVHAVHSVAKETALHVCNLQMSCLIMNLFLDLLRANEKYTYL